MDVKIEKLSPPPPTGETSLGQEAAFFCTSIGLARGAVQEEPEEPAALEDHWVCWCVLATGDAAWPGLACARVPNS